MEKEKYSKIPFWPAHRPKEENSKIALRHAPRSADPRRRGLIPRMLGASSAQ